MVDCENNLAESKNFVKETLNSARDHIEDAKKLQEGIKLRMVNMMHTK